MQIYTPRSYTVYKNFIRSHTSMKFQTRPIHGLGWADFRTCTATGLNSEMKSQNKIK
jgi:hypothetical protein